MAEISPINDAEVALQRDNRTVTEITEDEESDQGEYMSLPLDTSTPNTVVRQVLDSETSDESLFEGDVTEREIRGVIHKEMDSVLEGAMDNVIVTEFKKTILDRDQAIRFLENEVDKSNVAALDREATLHQQIKTEKHRADKRMDQATRLLLDTEAVQKIQENEIRIIRDSQAMKDSQINQFQIEVAQLQKDLSLMLLNQQQREDTHVQDMAILSQQRDVEREAKQRAERILTERLTEPSAVAASLDPRIRLPTTSAPSEGTRPKEKTEVVKTSDSETLTRTEALSMVQQFRDEFRAKQDQNEKFLREQVEETHRSMAAITDQHRVPEGETGYFPSLASCYPPSCRVQGDCTENIAIGGITDNPYSRTPKSRPYCPPRYSQVMQDRDGHREATQSEEGFNQRKFNPERFFSYQEENELEYGSKTETKNPQLNSPVNQATNAVEQTLTVVSHELRKLKEPKIRAFAGGYDATSSLLFASWRREIERLVNDGNLDDGEAIRTIQNSTKEKAREEVEFYLECKEHPDFVEILDHLRDAFSCVDESEDLKSRFYSRMQTSKETMDEFADSLQQLARQINSIHPDWRRECQSALKSQLARGLLDVNFRIVAKTELGNATRSTYTAFRSHLAKLFESRSSPKRSEIVPSKIIKRSVEDKTVDRLREAPKPTGTPPPTDDSKTPQELWPGTNGKCYPSVECRYCKKLGHFARECPKLAAKKAREMATQEALNQEDPKIAATGLDPAQPET